MDAFQTAQKLLRFARSPENPCFVCGQHNPAGLRVAFAVNGDTIVADWTPTVDHQGWQGVIHGGVLASLLDEAMAYTLFTRGCMGMTGRMQVRYRKPAQAGDCLHVEARCVHENGKIADIEGTISVGERIVAEASARFMKLGPIDPDTLFRRDQ